MTDETRRHMDIILEQHISDEQRKFLELSDEIKQLRLEIKALTEAWQQARGIVTFIKWCSVVTGGFVTFFLFIKDHWR